MYNKLCLDAFVYEYARNYVRIKIMSYIQMDVTLHHVCTGEPAAVSHTLGTNATAWMATLEQIVKQVLDLPCKI